MSRRRGTVACVLCAAVLVSATAIDALPVPPEGAVQSAQAAEAFGSALVPTGPWADGRIPGPQVEGGIRHVAWQVADWNEGTLALLAPLRDQLTAEGYEILFECDTDQCGGFDFRFALQVLPEPEMHVDLGDFRFASARRDGSEGPEYVCLLVSRSSATGFVQMSRMGPKSAEAFPVAASSKSAPTQPAVQPGPAAGIGQQLRDMGAAALDDLAFEPGLSELADGEYTSLAALAEFMAAEPDVRITLVGHTDATGSLAANVAVSQRRAQSVAERLVRDYGIDAVRLTAEGAGYLAPRATNATEDGRAKNRRVEAVLASTR